jgi:hypothetical protein
MMRIIAQAIVAGGLVMSGRRKTPSSRIAEDRAANRAICHAVFARAGRTRLLDPQNIDKAAGPAFHCRGAINATDHRREPPPRQAELLCPTLGRECGG